MIAAKADVTLHIDENIDTESRKELLQRLRVAPGILDVRSNDRTPHLMVVKYDPIATDSSAILHQVNCRGLHAELIGL